MTSSASDTTPDTTRIAAKIAASDDGVAAAWADLTNAVRRMSVVDAVSGSLIAIAYVVLFAKPMQVLANAWWNDPNSGHGLLLVPLSFFLAFKSGWSKTARPQQLLGAAALVGAVLARYAADLAAELFVMNCSALLALVGLVLWYGGYRQLIYWWLPFTLTLLSIPLPDAILTSVALPLQFMASKIGAGLLQWRDIPVRLSGNVIRIPGQELFVAEACSGLRSLTALLSLGVLMGGMFLEKWPNRVLLLMLTIPVAILINGFRIFLTGFLVLFVSPEMGEGFMHTSEGMAMFGAAFVVIAALAWLFSRVESRLTLRPVVSV